MGSGLRSRLTPTSSFAVFPGHRAPTRGAEGMAFHSQANGFLVNLTTSSCRARKTSGR
jgi:hypothetical protein